ncbi:MAG: adenylosuccinate lyase [Candidatus Omnitrophica bacterium]|nr:adenylosuccinate lyase [Candidatus Omnitrophota bacterium]MCM8799972.1 adenylosuccinate lyase [Candidatus Omnitrophota bacterium]
MIERYSLSPMREIWEDEFKFKKMLQVEILVCEALAKKRLIPKEAILRIKKKATFNIEKIKTIEEKTQHDVVAFINNLVESLGKDAQYLHMGLTSSDLLDTALGLQLKEASKILLLDLNKLKRVLAKKAVRYKDMICIGRTHGIHAEPITFGLKIALWYDEVNRNIKRLSLAKEQISIGKISGAVGTYANIDPDIEAYVCKKLGLKPASISNQIISRDIYANYLNTLAIIGASLEKFALEIRHLQRTEVREVEEPFRKGQKGSSAMPHKRNPVICERICGLARILRSYALAGMENIALWHERDISHSSVERIIIPDACILLDYMINKFIEVMQGLIIYPENMLANLVKTKGLIFSEKVLLELMKKGLLRPKAYDLVQRNAMKSWQENSDFKENLIKDREIRRYLSIEEIEKIFNLDYLLRHIGKIFKHLRL